MIKTKLGLPYTYQMFPELFDDLDAPDGINQRNEVIEKLLRKYNVKTVLDHTCGTGAQVFFLTECGYKVTGADFSPDLLKQARARALREKLNIKFIDGDMRSLQVGQFDAVITIFNAVGHLTKKGFEKAMRNIKANLGQGGIYIFDIFNLEAMNDEVVADFAYYSHKKEEDFQMHSTQCSSFDRSKGLLTSYDIAMIQKKAEKPQIINHKFSLQIYTSYELKEMLNRNGFEILEQYDMDGSEFARDKSLSILTVARRKE